MKKIFLVGGGTGGPTAPLLAVAEALVQLDKKIELVFIGSRKGPEQKLLKAEGLSIKHLRIPAGKWRRYFSLMNLVDLFKIFFGFLKALYLVKRYHPDLIFGAGSYVQVPVAWAGFFLNVPAVIHQQDIGVLLSTKLAAPVARRITVAFNSTAKKFPQSSGLFKKSNPSKVKWVGNPVRASLTKGSSKKAREIFKLNDKHPTVLVMGGGTGSESLNKVVLKAMPELVQYVQVIHLTGGKTKKLEEFTHEHYRRYEFLGEELKHAFAVADLVVSRGGMSTIGEIGTLGKPSVLIPLPTSPQEQNVELLSFMHAAVGVSENVLSPELLTKVVRKILWDADLQKEMRKNIAKIQPKNVDKKLAKLLLQEIQTDESK